MTILTYQCVHFILADNVKTVGATKTRAKMLNLKKQNKGQDLNWSPPRFLITETKLLASNPEKQLKVIQHKGREQILLRIPTSGPNRLDEWIFPFNMGKSMDQDTDLEIKAKKVRRMRNTWFKTCRKNNWLSGRVISLTKYKYYLNQLFKIVPIVS